MNRKTPFQIVLVEPEIPPNTGNVARLCGATCTPLHLVGKLGFSLDDRYLKRAGLDYWSEVEVTTWPDLASLQVANPHSRFVYTSKKADTSHISFSFLEGDFLVFGKETEGLPDEMIATNQDTSIRIPILGNVRSLNLSTAAGIVLYEALRQVGMVK